MKKIIFAILIVVVIAKRSEAQGIGIGTTSPNSSAMLDVSSTTKGMLTPRMNSMQRASIATPATGLLVFDTDTNSFGIIMEAHGQILRLLRVEVDGRLQVIVVLLLHPTL